jgi:hypothetical protein
MLIRKKFSLFNSTKNFVNQFKHVFKAAKAKKKNAVNPKISEKDLNEKMTWLIKKQVELEKNNFDDMVAQLIMSWSVCVLSIVMLRGLGYLELSDNVLIALASSPFISTCLAFVGRRRQ